MCKLIKSYTFNIAIIIIAITLNLSCKKNSDTDPVIVFTSPYEGQIFQISDKVNIVAHVTANQSLQFVKLSLLNSNYIAVDNITSFPVSGSSLDVNYTYTISNPELSGTYYITLVAYDGTLLTNGYQPITINALPLAREGIFVVTGSNFSNTNVYKFDTAFGMSTVISLGGDFSNSAISSMNQSLYTTGINNGYFNDINLKSNSLNWSVSNPGTGLPYFETVYNYNGVTYLGYYNQTIKGYDASKNVVFTNATASNTYPHTMFCNGRFLLVEQRNVSAYDVRLEVYYTASNAAYQEYQLNQDVVAMYSMDSADVIIFTNNNGNANVLLYNLTTNTTTTPMTLPSGKIYSAIQISLYNYLLAYQNDVYKVITSGLGNSYVYQTIPASAAMQFDSLNNQIFIANATHLNVYDNTTSGLINSFTLPDTIKDIRVLYNK